MPRLPIIVPLVLALLTGCAGDHPAAPEADLDALAAGLEVVPGPTWPEPLPAGALGWSASRLAAAHRRFEALESASLMVIYRGTPVAVWGAVEERYTVQSVRKPLLGALLGQEVDAGRLRLDATLAELGIDDSPPALTDRERSATVEDLLRSRSGIFHSALYEHGSWKRARPERGSHPPGSFWYYNNWDFNALGTLFEQSSGASIGEAFLERIARPVGMEDFRARDVAYLTRDSLTERMMGNDSVHAAYIFRMSTRDLARFGLLVLRRGEWGGRQVVPAEWVEASLRGPEIGWLEGEETTRYGYLWWIYPEESWLGRRAEAEVWLAQGARGHWLAIVPSLDLVFAHQVATGGIGLLAQMHRRLLGAPEVDDSELATLLEEIVAAHPARSVGASVGSVPR
jgi:CubicO group peptidase (beta-lactamase class C family)